MHGEHIGFGQSPAVAFSYLIVAAMLLTCAKYAIMPPKPQEHAEAGHGVMPAPANN
jgi:adenine/guanine/hypoxanthine permease